MACCYQCNKELSFNEIGAHKKFINRASREFLCKECLSHALQIPVSVIDEKIEQFKAQGCTLFC